MPIIEDLKSHIMTSIKDMADNAYKCEHMIEAQMLELYEEASVLGREFEEKIFDVYNKLNNANATEKIKPLLNKLEDIITLIDSNAYDWIDMKINFSHPAYKVSRWPIFVFIVSAMICLACSTIFHLFNAHSLKLNQHLSTLDYAGISILIAGSFYPPVYYAYFCFPSKIYLDSIWLYLGGISIAATITFFVSFVPSFQLPEMRWFRGCLFLILGLFGIIPLYNLTSLYFFI